MDSVEYVRCTECDALFAVYDRVWSSVARHREEHDGRGVLLPLPAPPGGGST